MTKTFTFKENQTFPKTTEIAEKLTKENEMPSVEVIENIKNYSKALSIRKSKHIEFFETILN